MESKNEIKKIRRMAKALSQLQGLMATKQINTSLLSGDAAKDVITTAEICNRFKLDRLVVYDLIKRGDLKAEKSNGWKISVASLDEYLTEITGDFPW